MKSRSSLCDPVLPISTNPQSEASQRLFNELLQNGKTHVQAERTVAELCRKTNLECQTLLSSSDRWMRSSPLNRGDRISLENQESGPITITYKRKQWKKPFCFRLNKEHFEKLKTKFYSIHNSGTTTTVDSGNPRVMHAFNILILSLLLRYSALSGGQLLQDLRGGGMQGAIHDKVFDVLQSFFGYVPWLEGFASPFNSYLPSFCSAFPDLEWHFGSVGSFMESSFQDCCVEANPPFSIGIINEMSNRLIGQLESANRKNKLLRFVVIVPTANGTDESAAVKRSAAVSHNRLITSPFCIKYILLPARNHGYIEGAQHLRPTRYKESAYDTSVIILDSSKKAPKDMETLERKLKAAFASRHEEERKKRALD
jgi:phosphorylated CTD-interacting factor 1